MSSKPRRPPPPTGVISVPDDQPQPGRVPLSQAPPTQFVQREEYGNAVTQPPQPLDQAPTPEPAPQSFGRPSTDFVRVDRFTDDEKQRILEAEQAREARIPGGVTAPARPGPPPAPVPAPAPAVPDEPVEQGSKRTLLMVVAAIAALVVLLLGGAALLGVGAWIALVVL